ncbi:MAG: MMPL family transporter, partial [Thermoplasmatales archaeon]
REYVGAGADMMGDTTLGEVSREIELALMDFDDEEKHVSMKASGTGIISNEMNELTEEANMIIMPAIFVIICLILLIMFRRFSYVLLPLISLGISIIWLFGTMVFLGISFNMMMVAIVPLLMGLGVDYSVHIFHEYRSELKKGKKPGSAIVASIRGIGMAMFLATLTTVIAFLSFLTATVPPLRTFGVLCALGLIYILITALTFQTAVRYVLDRKKTDKIIPKNNHKISLDSYMEKFSNIVLKQRKIILVLAVFITILMLSGATQVETTFDMNDFLPEDNESMELMINIGEYFPSSSETQEYILIEGNVASVKTLEGIAKTYENLKDDEYLTMTPDGDPKEKSILSIIRNAIRANSTLLSTFNIDSNGIPKDNVDVVGIYDYLYDHEEYMMEVRNVLHRDENDYDATVIRIYTSISYSEDSKLDTNRQMGIIYDNLNDDVENYGEADVIVAGFLSSTYTIMNSMTDSQLLSTFISIMLAAMVLVIVFRNPILGLITVIPVGLCIIWIIGTIYFLGYSFNIMTIMVTSLTIGIGIDYAIHATQRFRLTADKTGNVKKAVSTTIGHTGGALFIAALTTAAGFGMLILAPMPPEQQFGIIISMTIVYSYITSIIVLPPILMKWGKWRKKSKGYIISSNRYNKKGE